MKANPAHVTNHKRTFLVCNPAWSAQKKGNSDGYTWIVVLQITAHFCQLKPARKS